MINAWARMCKIIGQAFVRYLPVVMAPLIQAASLKPEIAFVDCKFVSQVKCTLRVYVSILLLVLRPYVTVRPEVT